MNTLVTLVIILASGAVLGQTPPNDVMQQLMTQLQAAVEQLFVKADLNKNGRFDTQDLGNMFKEYDTNGDQMVDPKEFSTRFGRNGDTLKVVSRGLFLDMDMDKNGKLEANDVQLYFDKIDENDDGQVEKQEFVNYFTQVFEVLVILSLRDQLKSTPSP